VNGIRTQSGDDKSGRRQRACSAGQSNNAFDGQFFLSLEASTTRGTCRVVTLRVARKVGSDRTTTGRTCTTSGNDRLRLVAPIGKRGAVLSSCRERTFDRLVRWRRATREKYAGAECAVYGLLLSLVVEDRRQEENNKLQIEMENTCLRDVDRGRERL
jgi:hypothetical protein